MKITLKNIKRAEFSSQETHCFEATVYVDDKRAFVASNDGQGGCNNYYPVDSDYHKMHGLIADIEAELGQEKIKTDYGPELDNCLEIVINVLVNEWLSDKDLKRLLKKIVYVKNGGMYTLSGKHKPTPQILAELKRVNWWRPEYILLNELTFDEAKKLYTEHG